MERSRRRRRRRSRRSSKGGEEEKDEEDLRRTKSVSILYSEDSDTMCFFVYT